MGKNLNIVKVGGMIVEDSRPLAALLDKFSLLPGDKALVVGGGRRATAVAAALGIESRMVDGRRITDAAMLEVVTMVYAGLVNKTIVAGLQARKVNAVGLSGADFGVICGHRRKAGEIDYGYVGDIDAVDTDAILGLLGVGAVPVFCPLTYDGQGGLLNTNADTIASAVACAMAAAREVNLIYCFEHPGVLADPSDSTSAIPSIDRKLYAALKAEGTITGGMIPKMDNAFAALEAGVRKVVITDAANLGFGGTEIIL